MPIWLPSQDPVEPLHGVIGPSSTSETGESRLADLLKGAAIEFFSDQIHSKSHQYIFTVHFKALSQTFNITIKAIL